MKLKEIYNKKKEISGLKISFEVFPPKEEFGKLYDELKIFKKYNPVLISVTSTSNATNCEQNEILTNIKTRLNLNVMPHLTCVRNTKHDVENYLTTLKKFDTECILALRGDFPTDRTEMCTDFKYANELVSFIKSHSDISIAIGGYPEGHIESATLDDDIKNLKRKVDAGADVIYTQLFYENEKLYRYIELVKKAGIKVPVVPGIMPVISYKQINRMAGLANITLPKDLSEKIEKYKDDRCSMREMGIEYASKQCCDLVKNGICGLHFYTLNKASSLSKILDNIL